jgi:hypothetical protein
MESSLRAAKRCKTNSECARHGAVSYRDDAKARNVQSDLAVNEIFRQIRLSFRETWETFDSGEVLAIRKRQIEGGRARGSKADAAGRTEAI